MTEKRVYNRNKKIITPFFIDPELKIKMLELAYNNEFSMSQLIENEIMALDHQEIDALKVPNFVNCAVQTSITLSKKSRDRLTEFVKMGVLKRSIIELASKKALAK